MARKDFYTFADVDENGFLHIYGKDKMSEWYRSLPNTRLVISMKTMHSTKQRKYYGWICNFVGNEIGYKGFEIHNEFKKLFIGGENPSTKEFSIDEMTKYIDEILWFCSYYLGIYIPDSNEIAEIQYYDGPA